MSADPQVLGYRHTDPEDGATHDVCTDCMKNPSCYHEEITAEDLDGAEFIVCSRCGNEVYP